MFYDLFRSDYVIQSVQNTTRLGMCGSALTRHRKTRSKTTSFAARRSKFSFGAITIDNNQLLRCQNGTETNIQTIF